MPKSLKSKVKYQGICMPLPLIGEIKKFVLKHPEYRSMGEFVKEAIREKLRREQN